MNVFCVVVLISASGYRNPVQLHGVLVKEWRDYFYVDFTEEFIKRKVDLTRTTMVQRINGNSCLFEQQQAK